MGSVERLDTNTLRVRTLWSPFPAWTFGIILGIVGMTGSLLLAFLGNREDDNLVPVVGIGFVGGYFTGALLWAIVGAAGGDTLRLTLDKKQRSGRVEQAILWFWRRDWDIRQR